MVRIKARPRLRVECAHGYARVCEQSTPAVIFLARKRIRPLTPADGAAAAGTPRYTDFRRRDAVRGLRPGAGSRRQHRRWHRSGPNGRYRAAGRGRPSGFGVFRRHVVIGQAHLEAGEAGAAAFVIGRRIAFLLCYSAAEPKRRAALASAAFIRLAQIEVDQSHDQRNRDPPDAAESSAFFLAPMVRIQSIDPPQHF